MHAKDAVFLSSATFPQEEKKTKRNITKHDDHL